MPPIAPIGATALPYDSKAKFTNLSTDAIGAMGPSYISLLSYSMSWISIILFKKRNIMKAMNI